MKSFTFILQKLFFTSAAAMLSWSAFVSAGCGQTPAVNVGNELTQLKITVSRNTENRIENKVEQQDKVKTLPVTEVPILEAGDVLKVRFCQNCPGRAFADLGFKRLLVFFVNPASVNHDLSSDNNKPEKAMAEIKFGGNPKSKKNLLEIYKEHEFKVPYKSIPLIFLVSDGSYKNELRKIILEKQADVLKLSEQTTLLSQLPEAVSFLLEVKDALQTPAINNPQIMQSFVQRAQIFRFNQTNCFRQKSFQNDKDRLGCLVNNINADELTNDIQNFSLERFAKLGAAETIAQLRGRYESLNIFFDAASAAIEIIGRLFKKKPLNIQIATLQTVETIKQAKLSQTENQSQVPTQVPSSVQAANRFKNTDGFLSLRQIPVNLQTSAERALLIAPMKWKESEEIIRREDLEAIDVFAARECLHQGENIFWLDTDHPLVKQEIKIVSVRLQKKSDESQAHDLSFLPVNPADGSVEIVINDSLWKKIKDWQEAAAVISINDGFETVEKELNFKILPAADWQVLRNGGEPVGKGEDTTLRITSNTVKRECLDKIVLTDQRKQSVELSELKGFIVEPDGIISLKLNSQTKAKLQAGKIIVEIYENGERSPSGSTSFKLAEK